MRGKACSRPAKSRKDLKVKVKEVKIPHLTKENKTKLKARGLGGLISADWSQTHKELVKKLFGHSEKKVTLSKYEYRGKPEAWTSEVWREVYNLPKTSTGGYVMKGKVQFIELQLLKLVKEDKWPSKSRVLLEQVEGNSDSSFFAKYLIQFLQFFGEAGALSTQLASLLPLCLVGYYGSYFTYAGLRGCRGKDCDETSEGTWRVQRTNLLRTLPCALVPSFQ
ncbi:hypothetical protein R1flu_023332 [Riccia fluitans]|uniref:LAGLIDADG homing endonuclease n=1 Tax=Riccia fluitans TaxID=41844 RepID=A0ABD1XRS2_9MARC